MEPFTRSLPRGKSPRPLGGVEEDCGTITVLQGLDETPYLSNSYYFFNVILYTLPPPLTPVCVVSLSKKSRKCVVKLE